MGSNFKLKQIQLLRSKVLSLEEKIAARATESTMDSLRKQHEKYLKAHPKAHKLRNFDSWLQSMDYDARTDESHLSNSEKEKADQSGRNKHENWKHKEVKPFVNNPADSAMAYYKEKFKTSKKQNKIGETKNTKDGSSVDIMDSHVHENHDKLTPAGHKDAAHAHKKILKDLQQKYGYTHKQLQQKSSPDLNEDFLKMIRPLYQHHYEALNHHRVAAGAPSDWIGPAGVDEPLKKNRKLKFDPELLAEGEDPNEAYEDMKKRTSPKKAPAKAAHVIGKIAEFILNRK